MMQTSALDKDWQIPRMADIYAKCQSCIVIPGGLGGIAGYRDTTQWIYRSWTLQEALLPPQAWCVFGWERGHGEWDFGGDSVESELIHVLDEGYAAMSSLKAVLTASTRVADSIGFTPTGGRSEWVPTFRLFSEETQPIEGLLAAIYAQGGSGKKLIDSEVADREMAIWRCALMRTSTREEDVVFSIMGLFGNFGLRPSMFKRNRLGASVALCQAILKQGGRAHWFGASALSPAPLKLCTMPSMPIATNRGAPVVMVPDQREGYKMVEDHTWSLNDAPKGFMDNDGFMQFTARLSKVTVSNIASRPRSDLEQVGAYPGFFHVANITDSDNKKTSAGFAGNAGTHAAVVGNARNYRHLFNGPDENNDGALSALLMLLKENDHGRWHKTGMAMVPLPFVSKCKWDLKQIWVGNQ